jgi:hypothetical protein
VCGWASTWNERSPFWERTKRRAAKAKLKSVTSTTELFLYESQKRFGTPASFSRAEGNTGAALKGRPPAAARTALITARDWRRVEFSATP